MGWKAVAIVFFALLPAGLIVCYEVRRWLRARRRWFIKRVSPGAPDLLEMEKAFGSMEKVFESMEAKMDKAAKLFGMRTPKMPKLPEMKGVFEEWYDADAGKWSPIHYGAIGFKTREDAETAMASLILLDPNQIGKMGVVKK